MKELKEQIQPYWIEEQGGVYIPLIDKVLLKDNVPAMSYYDYMEYAKTNRVQIATRDELLQMYLQKNQIDKILKEHNGDTLTFDCFNSSSEFNSLYVWFVYFDSGYCDYSNKSYPSVSRAVVDLKSKKTNNMKQFNLEEYKKNPNRRVITRDGRDVRIICTDRQGGDHPILALCTMSNESENLYSYLPNGRMYLNADADTCVDLFFAPEKHEGYINLYRDGDVHYTGEIHSSEAEAVSHALKKFGYVKTVKVEWEE